MKASERKTWLEGLEHGDLVVLVRADTGDRYIQQILEDRGDKLCLGRPGSKWYFLSNSRVSRKTGRVCEIKRTEKGGYKDGHIEPPTEEDFDKRLASAKLSGIRVEADRLRPDAPGLSGASAQLVLDLLRRIRQGPPLAAEAVAVARTALGLPAPEEEEKGDEVGNG